MDDQRNDRGGGRGIRALLFLIAAIGFLNMVAFTIHESFAGGMPELVEGKYFVRDKTNRNLYTAVSETTYRRLRLHESTMLPTTILGIAAFAGLIVISRATKNNFSTT